MFRWFLPVYLKAFASRSPELVLKRSLKVLDRDATERLKAFVKSRQTSLGGFADKAGRNDLYYTLFGTFLAEALDLREILPSVRSYVDSRIEKYNLQGVHMHCAAILAARLGSEKKLIRKLRSSVRLDLLQENHNQSGYHSFLHLLTCYYLRDLRSLWLIKKKLSGTKDFSSMPSPVLSAFIVLQKSYGRPVDELTNTLLKFYTCGGFRATHAAPIADLLSTAVSLYALSYAGHDLRTIKPECLNFVDSLFNGEGFAGNIIDNDADVEYTFYGLLALGALAD